MLYGTLVATHITGALGALITGFLAITLQANTPTHRIVGKWYLAMWMLLFVGGLGIAIHARQFSAFQVLNWLGLGFALRAYYIVLRRKSIGRQWLRKHYVNMLTSLAFVCIASIYFVIRRTMPELWWTIIPLSIAPQFIIPVYVRKLDQRYGFGKTQPAAAEVASAA